MIAPWMGKEIVKFRGSPAAPPAGGLRPEASQVKSTPPIVIMAVRVVSASAEAHRRSQSDEAPPQS